MTDHTGLCLRLRREGVVTISDRDDAAAALESLIAERDTAIHERDALRRDRNLCADAFKVYGNHFSRCAVYQDDAAKCDCGFDAALKDAP